MNCYLAGSCEGVQIRGVYKMEWKENLPDVRQWVPDSDQEVNLGSGLLQTCQAAQSRIIAEADIERRFNIHNYDSGLGVEDIVRNEFSKILPTRYAVDSGVVNDRDGRTAGDCDILIRNGLWAPVVKLGATPDSRRSHFPIEAIYSAIEVKQTLGFAQLDDAMKKLVRVSRLNRPYNPYGHITENMHLRNLDHPEYVLNPLHTTVLGTRIQKGISFPELAMRFGQINASLNRDEMVTELCVLGHGVAMYHVPDDNSGHREATFMSDRQDQLIMGMYLQDPDKAFYLLLVHLLGHLTRSVLEVHDLHRRYGRLNMRSELIEWRNAKFNHR